MGYLRVSKEKQGRVGLCVTRSVVPITWGPVVGFFIVYIFVRKRRVVLPAGLTESVLGSQLKDTIGSMILGDGLG
jgi:hypothetical protein